MPRGVRIAEPRQHLFAAAERVIAEVGPSGLTSRAVTREAGVATGLLFAHFANFDDFLVGYAVDRSFQIAGVAGGLPARAGSETIAANLSATVLATPLPTLVALTRLHAHRPGLTAEVERVLGPGQAALVALERAVAGYLAAEQELGRLPADVDAEAFALAAVGALHHVALTGAADSRVKAVIETLCRVVNV